MPIPYVLAATFPWGTFPAERDSDTMEALAVTGVDTGSCWPAPRRPERFDLRTGRAPRRTGAGA